MTDDSNPIEVIEKRRFLRLEDYFRVTFRPADDLGEPIEGKSLEIGYSKNLSLGGICFVTDHAVDAGSVVKAEILIPEIPEPVVVIGEVVRCIEGAGDRIEIAVKFLPFGIDEEQRNKLELFIYDHFLGDPD